MKRYFLSLAILSCLNAIAQPLKPFGAVPSASQLKWHDLQYYMFIHFGPNTFTNLEWGKGSEDPAVFNPTQLDCRQWAATAKKAGMKGIIITAKHHDGFCLWPSKFSTHTVRESSWKKGQGDILRELSAACKEYGLKFGVYLSPWDRNHPKYGTDEYNQIFVNMLGEVLGNYGDVFEQWFDGANGEGPNGKKQIYDWKLFNGTVYKHQPNAIIFSDGGPGCRWVGNENGFGGETNWCTLNGDSVYPGYPNNNELTTGHEDGKDWIPAECDVSIRPGWFYSDDSNNKVKTVKQLVEIYEKSIGRGGNLILNVPVDRRGLIPQQDSVRLMEFQELISRSYSENLIKSATITDPSQKNCTRLLTDGDLTSFWVPSKLANRYEIVITFSQPTDINRFLLQEHIALGQRIKSFKLNASKDNQWVPIAEGTTVGYKRILGFPTIQTNQLQLVIDVAKDIPLLNEVAGYFVHY